MSKAEFLLELLCEEIPANALSGVREQLQTGFEAELREAGLAGVAVAAYSTVRRLIVHIADLPTAQPDREEEVTGPPVKAAYTSDGSPTPAAVGFAKGQGVAVDSLRVVKGPKGDVVAATKQLPGRPIPDVLAEISSRVVRGLHFPKTMRWGRGEHTFVRPVHNVMALFGARTFAARVPVELYGVSASSGTFGHRIAAPGRIELLKAAGFGAYRTRLLKAGVEIGPDERRVILEEKARALAVEVGCEVRPDPGLLAELVELVEQPGMLRGAIADRFLQLPEEVLITTLRHHQKCLVLTRAGHVAPYFLAVCDRPDDPDALIQRGNEWVAGARLTDAAFFFAQDRKAPLASRSASLAKVLFHQKLGTFAVKAEKIGRLAETIVATVGAKVDSKLLARACELAKADLVTAMVGEFPELQGVVGGIYARLDGEDDAVWQAVYDQYTPAGLDGALPRGIVGAAVGVADRLDTLAGLFAAGEIPSGSKDPFALRRAALAVVRICAEAPLACDLAAVTRAAFALRSDGAGDEARLSALLDFLQERVRYYLTTVAAVKPETADAVISAHWGVVPDDAARARAVEAVRSEEVFSSLAVAFKRVRNMVGKSGEGRFDGALLKEKAEQELLSAVEKVEKEVQRAVGHADHVAGLRSLAKLAAPLDRFFTDVLVICDDGDLKAARLALLARVEKVFLRLADVSRLSAQ
ncbi:MAG: glycine--tRNA ligase subunit beta [Acidobacteriia bacterium]|nr:glycine--tRNA ligase subunit beta [Terriglobia bacterium]